MRKYIFIISILLFASCNRKTPQIIYKDKVVTTHDTTTIISKQTDTIPCDDFEIFIENEIHDTVYLKVVDKVVSVKYVKVRDTVFRETIVVQPQPRKTVVKTDNSVTAKKGSIVGDGNTMTTKKPDKFWLGVLCATGFFYLLGFGLSVLQRYVPISIFVIGIIRRFLPNGQ